MVWRRAGTIAVWHAVNFAGSLGESVDLPCSNGDRVELIDLGYRGILRYGFSKILTRALFEEIYDGVCHSTMEDSGLQKTQIEQVVLVGGSTRIPHGAAAHQGFLSRRKR